MEPFAAIMLAIIMIALPTILVFALVNRFFKLKERRMELEANGAAERAAQYAASNAELEARVRVLEKIVTDRSYDTLAQIEALRDLPPSPIQEKIRG